MFAILNRWIGGGLLALGVCLVGFGIYLGAFAWLNDGVLAGVGVFGTAGAFGAGLAVAGLALPLPRLRMPGATPGGGGFKPPSWSWPTSRSGSPCGSHRCSRTSSAVDPRHSLQARPGPS